MTKLYGNIVLVTTIVVVIFWVFMALQPARAGEIDLGSPLSPLLRTRVWNCPTPDGMSSVLLEPNDQVWKSDLIFFTKGTLQLVIREGHLTSSQSEKAPIVKCLRQPALAGDPYSLVGQGAFGSQPLRLPLVL